MNSGRNLANKTFVITGGSSGLGQAAVELLYEAGANVAILDRSDGKDLANTLGSRAFYHKVDVVEEESVSAALQAVVARFGALHGVVNCAGVASATKTLSNKGPHPLSIFDFVMKVNVYGSFNLARMGAEIMAKNQPDADGLRGVIINVASVAAFDGQKGQAAYAASKGALVSMALPMARDLAQTGVRVVTIAPGVCGTPLMQAMPENVTNALLKDVVAPRRFGKPSEFALCVLQIIENPYLNATCIRLDGGIRMSNL